MNKPIADVLEFAIIISHIAQGQAPSEVCDTIGVTFQALQEYAQEHDLMRDLRLAIDCGAAANDGDDDDECVITDRGECTTCAE